MNNEVIINGVKIQWNESKKVLQKEDGTVVVNYDPVFVPNGDEEPTFFGVSDRNGNVYDIYGHSSKVVDENKIKL